MNYNVKTNTSHMETFFPQFQNDVDYWDHFYSQSTDMNIRSEPSQFAAFCLTEMKDLGLNCLIELGAGNGRDSIFFASHNLKTLAMDNSEQAIVSIKSKLNENMNISLFQYDIRDELPDLELKSDDKCALYARFFIHALDEITLKRFFEVASEILGEGDFMFLEYRNQDDFFNPKVTEKHYRAFYTSEKVSNLAYSKNFSLVYEVSGNGFAKLKHDDASVTRQIFYFKG
jgi:hypothetical protein